MPFEKPGYSRKKHPIRNRRSYHNRKHDSERLLNVYKAEREGSVDLAPGP